MTAGRLVLPALRWRPESGFGHEREAIAAALESGAGGFIIFGGTAEAVRALTAGLRERAGRELLLAADLERGAGQQFAGLTDLPPPGALATLGRPAVTRAAAITAAEARSVGVNWVLAPVADLDIEPENPIVQSRSFGADPAAVADCVAAWVESCQASGALACVKHYPGHGRTRSDSHLEVPVVPATPAQLEAADLLPFRAGIRAKVAAVMTGHLAVPALDPSGAPATFSAPILRRLRRDGFDGLIVTDALIMGAAGGRPPGETALAAVRAGCDLLLYPDGPAAAARALGAPRALPDGRLGQSLSRYDQALERASLPPPPLAGDPAALAAAMADALLKAGLAGDRPTLRGPLELQLIDDDLGGPWPPSPPLLLDRLLAAAGCGPGSGGSRVLVVAAEPRGWKGRAGLSPEAAAAVTEAQADLAVLFGHPRLARTFPPGLPVLVAWHRQMLMQRAVAGRLAAWTA